MQNYNEFLDWCRNNYLLTSRNRLIGRSRARKKELILIEEAEHHINKLINFTDIPNDLKLRYIIDNITKKTFECPVCLKPRGRRNGSAEIGLTCGNIDRRHMDYINSVKNKHLMVNHPCHICGAPKSRKKYTTCGKKDKYHDEYRKKIWSEKTKDTLKKKYGVINISKVDSIKKKKEETCLANHGVLNPSQAPGIKKKKEETCMQHFGVKNPLQSEVVLTRMQKTCLKKYGVPFYIQTDKCKKRIKDTNLKRYGVTHYMQTNECKNRIKDTNLKRYGTETATRKHYNIQNFKNLTKKNIKEVFLDNNNRLTVTKLSKFINCSPTTTYNLLHSFGIKWTYGPGGFNPDKEATLYYIKDKDTNLYKIGITNNSLSERFGKAFLESRAEILMEQSYENGQDAYLAEQEILQAFKPYRCNNDTWPEAKGGKTEFFNRNILEL